MTTASDPATPRPDETPETPEMAGRPVEREAARQVLESPAYPAFLRILAVVIVVDVVALALWSLPALRAATWSAGSLAVLGLAGIGVLWMGMWVVRSRTRLDGDVLTQTWLWNRRAHAGEVVQMKLVHWAPLQKVMAPRLLVKRRNGAIGWFQSADPALLTAFAQRVGEHAGRAMLPPRA